MRKGPHQNMVLYFDRGNSHSQQKESPSQNSTQCDNLRPGGRFEASRAGVGWESYTGSSKVMSRCSKGLARFFGVAARQIVGGP